MILLVEDLDHDRDLALLTVKQTKAPGEVVSVAVRGQALKILFKQFAPAHAA